MSDAINLTSNLPTVIERLEQIARQVDDMRPAYAMIGEVLTESTKERFDTSTSPDGARWAPLAEETVLGRLAEISGVYTKKKSGKLSKKGQRAVMGMRPLVDSGILQDTIAWQADATSAQIGTNRFAGEWDGGAAVHQFGNRDGTIPARPFLGVSPQDETTILEILAGFLRSTTGAE